MKAGTIITGIVGLALVIVSVRHSQLNLRANHGTESGRLSPARSPQLFMMRVAKELPSTTLQLKTMEAKGSGWLATAGMRWAYLSQNRALISF